MAMWNDYEKLARRLDRIANAFERIADALEADRKDEPIIYGNEHNCIMTMFGECSYNETGCGDCAVVEKVRKALNKYEPKDKPQLKEDGELEILTQTIEFPDTHQRFMFTRSIRADGDCLIIGDWEYKGKEGEPQTERSE